MGRRLEKKIEGGENCEGICLHVFVRDIRYSNAKVLWPKIKCIRRGRCGGIFRSILSMFNFKGSLFKRLKRAGEIKIGIISISPGLQEKQSWKDVNTYVNRMQFGLSPKHQSWQNFGLCIWHQHSNNLFQVPQLLYQH